MNNNTRIGWSIFIILVVIAAIVLIVVYAHPSSQTQTPPGQTQGTGTTVAYSCDAGKNITATYYQGGTPPTPASGQPPTPTGSVALTLSDGRTMTLPQTISADGTRYANADESFVFWSKGNGAFVTENNQQTFSGCIMVAPDPTGGSLSQIYSNSSEGFSLRLPAGFTPDASYTYQELGPGQNIGGVKFTIAPSIAKGTNLSSDSYVSVEEIPQTTDCSASLFLPPNSQAAAQTVTDNGTTYSMETSDGAAAGNRYDETVYAIPGTNPCIAVRYFIHYGVIQNYPAGTVTQFDEAALVAQFDQIRRTLVINQ